MEKAPYFSIHDEQPTSVEITDLKIKEEYSFGPSTREYKVSLANQKNKHDVQVANIQADSEQCPELNKIKNYYRRLGNTAI